MAIAQQINCGHFVFLKWLNIPLCHEGKLCDYEILCLEIYCLECNYLGGL